MTEFNLNHSDTSTLPMIEDDVQIFMQEISILFGTNNTDVLGCEDDWVDVKHYIFKTNINAAELRDKVDKAISRMCSMASKIPYTVKVSFIKGEFEDIGLIDLHLTDSNGNIIPYRALID